MSYKDLSVVKIDHLIEKKGNLDYLSWAHAWNELHKLFPDAQRTIYEDPLTGWNYFTDGSTGWVKVGITVNGLEHIDYLPIMNYKNKSIPAGDITTFDVVKTIQRSTVKAIALHGLGINLWMGEDTKVEQSSPPPKSIKKKDKIIVKKNDSNWKAKIVPWIKGLNGTMSLDDVIINLQKKYIITPTIKKHIENEYNNK